MRKITPIFAATAAMLLMAGGSALAATNLGAYTVTATNSQFTTTYPGAVTFTDSNTFSGYSGSATTSVATITGGALNYAGSTNPGSGFNNSLSNYVSAVDGADETIAFTGNQKYFGLLWGSVDSTNTISFFENSTLVASFTGAELNSDGVGLQEYPANGSFVDFVANGSGFDFNKVVLSAAGGDPFETANFAAIAVPEPATWAMMILGLGAMGVALRRRRDTGLAAA